MSKLPLRSLTVQIIILFVAAFAVVEIITLGNRYFAHNNALSSLEAVRIADNVAVISSLIENTPSAERAAATRLVHGSSLSVSWETQPWVKPDSPQSQESALLQTLLARVLEPSAAGNVLVSYGAGSERGQAALAARWKAAEPFSAPVDDLIKEFTTDPILLVSVPLRDGTWLNFGAGFVESIEFWPLRSIVLICAAMMVIVALAIWAIRRLTAPFGEFAAAATRLGMDVNAEPIPERGPSEVLTAIQAFNAMQLRLQRFIEDRTEMLAAVSHDLRTPMTRLRLRAEYLNDRTQYTSMLRDLGEMESMITGILAFAKDDVLSEPTVTVDLETTIQSISDDFVDAGHNVSFAGSGRLSYPCRHAAIRRCLTNVVENAIKYGHQARLSVEVTDPEILIHVDDSGPGIPKEFREDVFRPFFRLEASRNRESGGSGLGLTVARSVARAHGGDVIFAVSPDGGFRVTVALPQPKPKPLPQTATGAVTQAPTKTLASAQSERQ